MKQNKGEDIQKTNNIKTSKIASLTLEVCIFHKSFHIKTFILNFWEYSCLYHNYISFLWLKLHVKFNLMVPEKHIALWSFYQF